MDKACEKENITFRKASIDDIESLADLRIRFLFEYLQDPEEKDVPSFKIKLTDYFKKAISSGEFISYIAERSGKMIGCSGMIRWNFIPSFVENSEKRGYIFNMYTVPDARREGIASTLLTLLINEARAHGIGHLHLHALSGAESIYRNNGFTDPRNKELVLKL